MVGRLGGRAAAGMLAAGLALSGPVRAETWSAPAAPDFQTFIHGQPAAGHVAGAFVMPGQTLKITARDLRTDASLVLNTGDGRPLAAESRGRWRWSAPRKPGLYRLTVRNRGVSGVMHVNVFVKTPFDGRRTAIGGYRIGHYAQRLRHDNAIYAPPNGLIRVTRATAETKVAPGLTVGDFLCHQQPALWPKYLIIRPKLLTKLDRITAALRARGIRLRGLTIMSGYRTPWYNAAIGNTTRYSRHLYGGAADIFVDANNDHIMDDLNGDGRIDLADAEWLAAIVTRVDTAHPKLAGGLSAYPGDDRHGPFVHVDVRGTAVRW